MEVSEYKAYAENIVTHYQSDIDIDLGMMKGKDPAIIFLRNYGTHAILLEPIENYPAKGERVPYLFGTADRGHLLRSKREILAHCIKEKHTDHIVYFNGSMLEIVSLNKAIEILSAYEEKMTREFAK